MESVPSVGQATTERTTETTALVSLKELEALLDSCLFDIQDSFRSLQDEIVEGNIPAPPPNDLR